MKYIEEIRAEIQESIKCNIILGDVNRAYGLKEALTIIDKHISENENKN